MTNIKLIFPDGDSFEVASVDAEESRLIKFLIQDTKTREVTLPNNLNLDKFKIIKFFRYYRDVKYEKYQEFSFTDILTFTEIADYFDYSLTKSLIKLLFEIFYYKEYDIDQKFFIGKNLAASIKDAIFSPKMIVPILDRRGCRYTNHFNKKPRTKMIILSSDCNLRFMLRGITCQLIHESFSNSSQLNLLIFTEKEDCFHSSSYEIIPVNNCFIEFKNENINCEWLSHVIEEVIINEKIYNDYRPYINKLIQDPDGIRIFRYRGHSDLTRPIPDSVNPVTYKIRFSKISATKYNTYVFGTAYRFTFHCDLNYRGRFPYAERLFDDEYLELYRRYSAFNDIYIFDIATGEVVFMLTLPEGQYYSVDDSGYYFVTFYKIGNILELYDVIEKRRILFKDLSKILIETEYELKPIINIHNKLIYIEVTLGRYLILDFEGNVLYYPNKSQIMGRHYCLPMKNGVLTLIDMNDRKTYLYLCNPVTLKIISLILEDENVINGPMCYKIAVSPSGERFCFYGKTAYKGRLFPNSQEDYSYIESLLK